MATRNVKILTETGVSTLDSIFQRKVLEMTDQNTTLTLKPNTLYVWDSPASLNLTLPAATSGVYEEFMIRLTTGATAPTVTITPASGTLNWKDNNFTIEANSVYDMSILNNYGIIAKVG